MSQNSARGAAHPNGVDADLDSDRLPLDARPAAKLTPAIDLAARQSKRMYEGLSASSAGLELGISVGLGALFGAWLDGKLGTEPWMLLVFLALGLYAGFRGVMRAVAREDRAASRG